MSKPVCGGCFKETVEWIVRFLSIIDVLYMYYSKKINAMQQLITIFDNYICQFCNTYSEHDTK